MHPLLFQGFSVGPARDQFCGNGGKHGHSPGAARIVTSTTHRTVGRRGAPDLVKRFRAGRPLAEAAPMSDWYSPASGKGYADSPADEPENNGRSPQSDRARSPAYDDAVEK